MTTGEPFERTVRDLIHCARHIIIQLYLQDGAHATRIHSGKMLNKTLADRKKTSRLTLQDFKYDKELHCVGQGHFAEAFRAQIYDKEIDCDYEVVVKVINKAQLIEEGVDILQEINIHSNLRHENICRFYGHIFDETTITLILEYCENKSLFDYIQEGRRNAHKTPQGRRVKKLEEDEAAWFIRDIANGLRHCHENGVIHRDLKPENLLVDRHKRIKIIDFGMAKRILNDDDEISKWCGTVEFFSPQIVNEVPYKYDVDIWALGVVGFEMLTGRPPFFVKPKSERKTDRNRAQNTTIELIKDGSYVWPSDIHVSTEARDLIDGLLERNPDDRIPLTYVLNHHWIVKHEKDDIRETVVPSR